MTLACALILVSTCGLGSDLDEARSLVQRGLLREAEQRLEALLAPGTSAESRASALLLLGNVDYERGHYHRALEHYVEAEREAGDDAALIAAAQGNREMAAQRLARGVEIAEAVARLRRHVAAVLLLGGVAVAWLARRPS